MVVVVRGWTNRVERKLVLTKRRMSSSDLDAAFESFMDEMGITGPARERMRMMPKQERMMMMRLQQVCFRDIYIYIHSLFSKKRERERE